MIIIILAGALYWYKDYSLYITTDDAHVDADNVSVGSKIIGRIASIYANEGDHVKQGTLLAVLDSTDLIAQRNQAIALKGQAQANYPSLKLNIILIRRILRYLRLTSKEQMKI